MPDFFPHNPLACKDTANEMLFTVQPAQTESKREALREGQCQVHYGVCLAMMLVQEAFWGGFTYFCGEREER